MNPDSMCIEEGLNPLPFHGKFEADFWESVNRIRLSTHILAARRVQVISTVKIWKCHLFTKMVQKRNLSLKE